MKRNERAQEKKGRDDRFAAALDVPAFGTAMNDLDRHLFVFSSRCRNVNIGSVDSYSLVSF